MPSHAESSFGSRSHSGKLVCLYPTPQRSENFKTNYSPETTTAEHGWIYQ